MNTLKRFCLLIVSLGCFLPSTGYSAVDFFLKIDGIPGESADSVHTNEIDILSFSWGASQAGAFATTGNGGAGKVSIQDIHFYKSVDKATGPLFIACLGKGLIPHATFTVVTPSTKAGMPDISTLVFTMTNVVVTGVNENGTTVDASGNLVETISLNFTKISWTYTPMNSDGSAGTPVTGGWDLKANKGI